MTRLPAGQPRNNVSISWVEQDNFIFSENIQTGSGPIQPPCPLPIQWVTGHVFSEVKPPEREAGHLYLVLTLRMNVAVLSLSHITLWHAERQIYVNFLNLAFGGKP